MNRTEASPWTDFDLVRTATTLALEIHRNDVRKASSIPYVSHLWSVAALVLEHGGDDVQVAAALLHDAAEDHGGEARLASIEEACGPEVSALVRGLSDSLRGEGEAKAEWGQRKAAYLRHLREASPRLALVSACDKLHNARCIVADLRDSGPAVWSRFNVADPRRQVGYYRGLLAALDGKAPPALAEELRRTVDEMGALAGVAPGEELVPGAAG